MTKHTSRFLVYNVLALLSLLIPSKSIAQCASSNGIIVVNNTNATGVGSLHNAITCANNTAGPNTIQFNIPGNSDHVIYVGSGTGDELPTLFDNGTIIDGSTQPGFGINGDTSPKIILDGSQFNWTIPINAIFVRADYCEIYGIEIRNFPDDGIDLYQASNCIVGEVGRGNVIYSTGSAQDYFPGLPNTGPWEGCGVVVRQNSNNCVVEGNTIGTDENLTSGIGIEYIGILNRSNSHNSRIQNNLITSCFTGIRVDQAISVLLSDNSIYCNSNAGIQLSNGGNYAKQPPFISSVSTSSIVGGGASGDVAEIYISDNSTCQGAPCQGKILLGSAVVLNGQWTLNAPFINGMTLTGGEAITATLRDGGNNTTAFATCQYIPASNTCAQPDGSIFVTNTNDAGPGSLREAINCANNNTGPNTIKFAIPGNGKHYINVGNTTSNELPALLDDYTTIDATTQTGFGNNGNYDPRIVLDGLYNSWDVPINAVWVRADYCEVYGLEIVNFPDDGIDVTAVNYCKIGAPNKGNVIYNNGSVVDYFPGLPNTGPWEGCGIVLKHGASNCIVQGNTIGVNYAQTVGNGNEDCGVVVQNGGDNNQIGGIANGAANYIARNLNGVVIAENSVRCEIQENEFVCNEDKGIWLRGNANDFQQAPAIQDVDANSVTGTAFAGDRIELYLSNTNNCGTAICQGSVFLGKTTVPLNGQWAITAPFANGASLNTGDEVTATSTDPVGNSSEFASCTSFTLNCNIAISSANYSNTICGLANGTITYSAAGGIAPYTFAMGGFSNNNGNFSSMAPGSYTVTVTDVQGCTATDQVSFTTGIGTPALNISNVTQPSCGQNNGVINLFASGGLPGYTYDIGQGPTTNSNFINLSTGGYTITVTDQNGCTDIQTVTLIASSSIIATINNVSAPACNSSNGSFTVIATGGSGVYGYDIGNGTNSNNTFSNLVAGTYTVTVTDGNGCSDTDQVTLASNAGPSVFVSSTDATCGLANGVVNITASGGTPPFAYDIGFGQTSNNIITDLSGGNYNVTVTDAFGCTEVKPIAVQDDGMPQLFSNSVVHEACDGTGGSFSVSVTGGSAPYFYDLGNGQSLNANYSNLSAGSYMVTVTDMHDCTATTQVNINPRSAPGVNIGSLNFSNCGQADGSFLVSGYGGMPPYTYDIGNGFTASNSFTGLSAGDFVVTIKDANGCTDMSSVTLGTTNGPTVTVVSVTDANCGQNNGSFDVSATGGTPPYTYNVGNGVGVNPSFPNLAAGSHTVTITDANNCNTTVTQEIQTTGGLPTAGFSYNASGLSVSFVDDANDATSVAWDFSGGNISNVPSPSFLFPATGSYIVCQTVTNACGTAVNCQTLELIGGDVFTLTVGEGAGSVGSIVSIPVTIENFDDIVGFSNSFQIADPSVARFVGTSGYNLVDLGAYSFNISNNTMTVAWFDLSIAGVTVSDNTVLFYIDIELLGNIGDCSDILIDGNPTQQEVIKKSGNTEINVPYVMNNGNVCVDFGDDVFTLSVMEASGVVGSVVSIPVMVENFEDLVGFSTSFQVADPSVARFVGTSGHNLVDLGAYSFNVSNNTMTVAWFDLSIAGISIPDNSIIFYIDVELLGNGGDCTAILLDGNPTQQEVIAKSGNTEVNAPYIMNEGAACIEMPLAFILIAGETRKENDVAVRDVEINCTGGYFDWTTNQGEYNFPMMAPNINYTIDPKKDTLHIAGVTTIDLVRIQEHILANALLDSPYKIIAADINNSGSITTLDLIYLQDLILARTDSFPNNESWRFVPESYVFTDPMFPFQDNFPEVISLNSPMTDEIDQNFVSIKVGDVTLSSGAFLQGPIEETVALEIKDQSFVAGEIIDIPIDVRHFEQVAGMQGDILFDEKILAFEGVITGELQGVSANTFGTKYLENGVLPFSWFNPNYSPNGATISPDETLYIMRFRVLQSGSTLQDVIQIGSVNTKLEVFKSDYTLLNITLEVMPGTVAAVDNPTNSTNQVITCFPNPFSENTMINFTLPERERIELSIHDSRGVLVKNIDPLLEKGHHSLSITASDLPAFGIYYYRLSTSANEYVGKMIHLNRQ